VPTKFQFGIIDPCVSEEKGRNHAEGQVYVFTVQNYRFYSLYRHLTAIEVYLLMGGAVRTTCGPYVRLLITSVKSYFPTSNANSDCRFGFYAKKHVGHSITGSPQS
jgi:hypothetical protein